MLRTILAVLGGLFAALVVIAFVQWFAMSLFVPAGTVLDDEQDLARLVEDAPIGMFLVMLLGWALSSFAGGWIATRIARRGTTAAIVVGLLILVGLAFTVFNLPYPRWLAIANILLPVPTAWLASRLALRRSTSR